VGELQSAGDNKHRTADCTIGIVGIVLESLPLARPSIIRLGPRSASIPQKKMTSTFQVIANPTEFFALKKQEIKKKEVLLKVFFAKLDRCGCQRPDGNNELAVFPNCEGERYDPSLKEWHADEATKNQIREFILTKKHDRFRPRAAPDGWKVGEIGSVWCDAKINGRMTRFSLYFKETSPETFKSAPPHVLYAISFDASK